MKEKYTPQQLPYHLIVPSLPGYAFSSSPPLDRDFGKADISALINQLMVDLGFGTGYIVQGGDIGSFISRFLGLEYEACKAVHVNFFPVYNPPEEFPASSLTAKEQKGLKRGEEFMTSGRGYSEEHSTRPSTIGLVLGSNPLALLAWIGEKFILWSDETPSLDIILESVTLYWLTETFPTSIYPYRERLGPQAKWQFEYMKKPLGYSLFPFELVPMPISWVKSKGNLVFAKDHEKGGHFAALEQPQLLMQDLEEFIQKVWT